MIERKLITFCRASVVRRVSECVELDAFFFSVSSKRCIKFGFYFMHIRSYVTMNDATANDSDRLKEFFKEE